MIMPREWVRGVQWVAGHREEWEPILRAAQAAWSEMELVSVSERLRDSALVQLEPAEIPRAASDVARAGLAISILEHGAYGRFRAAVHVPGLAAEWHLAWEASDHQAIGRMLGFPDCCREFFARAWAGTSDRDITPAMGSVDGPWQANTMLRWLGVRLVPHLPCSADCAKTIANAEGYLAMGARLGIDLLPLETLLRLPVTHDALNGVVIVSTPHFRFMAGGSEAPFSVARPGQPAEPREPATWTDNGFGSLEAMDRAHETVLAVVGDAKSALDLGAGDGRLLYRLAQGATGAWRGIEVDRGRAERGNRRHGPIVVVISGRIQDAEIRSTSKYDVVLLMPGRLIEMEPERAERVRSDIVGRRLVLYAYDEWLTRHGSLEGLAEAAGLRLVGPVKLAPGVAAAEGVVR